jgi:hypothetical protein
MLALLSRHGIDLAGGASSGPPSAAGSSTAAGCSAPTTPTCRRPGDRVDDELEEFDDRRAAAGAGIGDAACPASAPRRGAPRCSVVADVAHRLDLGPLASLFRRRDSQGEFAEEPARSRRCSSRSSAPQHGGRGVAGTVRAHRVAAASAGVARGMAAGLGEHTISFGEHLHRGGRRRRCRGAHRPARRAADHLVLPARWCRCAVGVRRPVLPPAFGRAVAELGYGTVTKTAVQWPRVRGRGYATTGSRAADLRDRPSIRAARPGMLMAYCGGDGGRRWASARRADRMALAAVARCVPCTASTPSRSGAVASVEHEPRFGGSYAVVRAGSGHRALAGVARAVGSAAPGRRARRHLHRVHGGCGRVGRNRRGPADRGRGLAFRHHAKYESCTQRQRHGTGPGSRRPASHRPRPRGFARPG